MVDYYSSSQPLVLPELLIQILNLDYQTGSKKNLDHHTLKATHHFFSLLKILNNGSGNMVNRFGTPVSDPMMVKLLEDYEAKCL